MKVLWILYCEAPALHSGDFMSCCPGITVAAGSWEASVPVPHLWAIPGTRAEVAAWLFACRMFMWSDFRITAVGTSFDLALMGSKGG